MLLLGIYPRAMEAYIHPKAWAWIFKAAVHSPKLELKMSNRWTDKQIVANS